MTERQAYLGLSIFHGIGPIGAQKLRSNNHSLSDLWDFSETELRKTGFPERLIGAFITFCSSFSFDEYEEKLHENNVWYVAQSDQEYPDSLRELNNPPLVIFGKGNKELLHGTKCIGIVGTRKMSSYGKAVTQRFAEDLGNSGFTIISGLALGVDAVAHEASVKTPGKTIAVLGNGVNICFPRIHESLYNKILEYNGLIISEYSLNVQPSKGSFPARNRIIAALSQSLLVTEGQKKSGSLITAEIAMCLHKKVFAIPGPITSHLSDGPLFLIQKGATLVTSPDEIYPLTQKTLATKAKKDLPPEEMMIITLLSEEERTLDQLISITEHSLADISTILSQMEIKGLIRRTPKGTFFPVDF